MRVLVAGSGVMGRGIANGFARAGVPVAVLRREAGRVAGLDAGVEVVATLPEAPPELTIESIPEIAELKRELYGRIEAAWGGATILASNTSGLDLQALADDLAHPESFVGIHYFQPADVAPLVEVARVRQTLPDVLERAAGLIRAKGKRPIVLHEPIPGLLINRLQHAVLHEAYWLIEQGICTAADVDLVAKELLGPRMSVTGLIEQKDISGLDTHALAQAAIVPALHHGDEPRAVLQDKYKAGELGVKTGTGFYDWRNWDIDRHRAQASGLLGRLLALLAEQRPKQPPLAGRDG